MKEPPDKYHTMKCPLSPIMLDDNDIPTFFDATIRSHKLVIQAYQFVRLWTLKKFHDKEDIPEITEDVFKMAFIILNGNTQLKNDNDEEIKEKQKAGPKPKGDNATLLKEFNNFYDSEYKNLNYEKVSALHLSQILGYMATDMLTNVEKEQTKKQNMKNKKNEMKENCKDMTQNEKDKYKKELEKMKKENDEAFKLKNKEKRDEEKKKLKKLSKEEQQKIKDAIKKEKHAEFPYLEELTNSEIEELKKANKVYVDPGKRDLLYMMNDEGKIFVYSNRQHVNETKRLKYQRLLKNHKDKEHISEKENELKDFNSKTCNYNKFKEYILNKNKINNELMVKYQDEKFRKYKWYSFINKKKAESKLINTINKVFTKDKMLPTLIYGDWSIGQQMRNYMSTPNIGLKRKIAEYFRIYSIDEFRTSLLNYRTEEKNEYIYLPDNKGITRKIHSVLTYQMENKRLGCINRDKNSVNNMKKITEYFLKNKSRPERYRRGFELEAKPKEENKRRQPRESRGVKPKTQRSRVQLHS